MSPIFSVGDTIEGYCNGYFGRDDYKLKTCTYITHKYAVFEYQDGTAVALNFDEWLEETDFSDWDLKKMTD
jgi:hypothetical protein